MKRFCLMAACAALAGCVGSPVRDSIVYDSKQTLITQNNKHLLGLTIGMERAAVQKIMGAPERSEGYSWGTVWMYRTAMTSGIYGTADSDFTPVVLDASAHLSGWGRNYFEERARKSQVEIIQHTDNGINPAN